ncbi:DUF2961 domain-containing protein [Rhodococcus hoagii]|nr:DUF2961 domain-containing protein [Prescottella equi]
MSCTELGLVQSISATPTGDKATVLAESWGSPGVINHIWTANTGADASISSFIETGGRIRVFADNSKTPVVDLTLSEFFGYVGRAGIYATPRVGRTARDTDRSSAYRYVDIPFTDYMRVEVVNTTAVQANAFYGMVSYTLGDEAGALKSYSIQSKRVEANKFDRITVADFQGAGQIESLFLAFEGESDGDYGAMEGNVEIYLDGETSPSWRSPGGEDASTAAGTSSRSAASRRVAPASRTLPEAVDAVVPILHRRPDLLHQRRPRSRLERTARQGAIASPKVACQHTSAPGRPPPSPCRRPPSAIDPDRDLRRQPQRVVGRAGSRRRDRLWWCRSPPTRHH